MKPAAENPRPTSAKLRARCSEPPIPPAMPCTVMKKKWKVEPRTSAEM
jgi:hypothetical protein